MLEILRVFFRLGLTSFGGPVAHIGYFHREFVSRQCWVTNEQFNGWLAVCQALPGPASSQLGFLIGWHRAGLIGALLAWVGFTLPSAIALVMIALYGLQTQAPWLPLVTHGLKIVAIAVVAQAVVGMFRSLCQGTATRLLAAGGLAMSLALGGWTGQIGAIAVGGLVGLIALRPDLKSEQGAALSMAHAPKRTTSLILLAVMLGLLLVMPWMAQQTPALQIFDGFYRAGALVFGGGHVVLPLLESATVSTGLVSNDDFLTGYSLAQAVPGPLFTFAAWLGALDPALPGWTGAAVALIAVFLPGLLLVLAAMPAWQWLSSQSGAMGGLLGVNASVVGVLAGAWINPIVLTTLGSMTDVAIAITCTGLLLWKKPPVWVIVILAPAMSVIFNWISISG